MKHFLIVIYFLVSISQLSIGQVRPPIIRPKPPVVKPNPIPPTIPKPPSTQKAPNLPVFKDPFTENSTKSKKDIPDSTFYLEKKDFPKFKAPTTSSLKNIKSTEIIILIPSNIEEYSNIFNSTNSNQTELFSKLRNNIIAERNKQGIRLSKYV